jgi:MFS superfamily sulfate permease-like transporter
LTPLFRDMPQPTLAAIVIAAMLHLTKPRYLRDLFLRNSWAFAIAMIVFLAELTLGVMHGIALGVGISLLLLIYLVSHPHGGVLGQLPGSEAYRDIRRRPEARTFPGLLIWRVGGDLFFASIGYMEAALKSSIDEAQPPAKHVLLDFSSVNYIDVSACDELVAFIKKLKNRQITVAFARVRDSVRQDMQLGKIESVVGPTDFYERITDGVTAWQHRGSSQN